MPTAVRIRIGKLTFEAQFNDSDSARAVIGRMPLSVVMSRWGEKYYGNIGEDLGQGSADDARAVMAVGEMAYWPEGNAVSIFFGPTPASTGEAPVAASPVNPIGKVAGDLSPLKPLGKKVTVELELA